MTIRRHSADSHKVSDLMTTPTPISRSTINPLRDSKASRLSAFVRGAAVCLGLAAASLTTAGAQQTSTAQPVLLADFNHDGIPDALVVSTTSPTATIAFGSVPYGTFSVTSKAVTFPAGCVSLPQGSVLTGDFNGDGFADIAFFCSDASGVMLGNGDGTFSAPKLLTNVSGTAVVTGDFNKDGKLDLAVLGLTALTSGAQVEVIQFLPGNGDGTFAAAVNTQLDGTTYSAPLTVDLNGDGYPDIAVLNVVTNGSPSVAFLSNNQDGTFGTLTQGVATPNTTVNVPASAASILAGHFFSPTSIDVAVSGTGANAAFSVIKNTSTTTQLSFADPVTIPYAGLTAAVAGSFTGSGFTDLAASNGTSIAVLVNDGTGNFSASYPSLTLASTSPLFAVADANGDGYSDIYTATSTNGALSLATSVTSGSATATSQPFTLSLGTRAISATWNGNVNLLGSTATGQQIVTGAVSVATVTSSKNPSTIGDSVTFNVAVASSLPSDSVPTGTVVLSDGTTMLASGTLDGSGNFSYTTAALTTATHPITATYAGDNFFAASTSPVLSQVVNPPPSVGATITAPPTTPPGSQTTITVALAQPYPVDLQGTLTIGFTRATTPQITDPSLQFAAGGTTLTFPIPANTTAIPPIELQAGTIAGTITIPLSLTAGGVNVTPADPPTATIVVPPAVPSVSGMTVTRNGNQLTVVMHGFSNTREVVNAKFHFTSAPGATLGTSDLTLPADNIFNTLWFDTDPSDAYGSTFTYTQIFNTSDDAANIGSVDATLTNTVGPSTAITAK